MIVFEGIDCSGKTTAIQYTKKKLEQLGKDVIIMDDWTGDKKLKYELLDLLEKPNSDTVEGLKEQFDIVTKARKETLKLLSYIEEIKSKNIVILYDRYCISTLVYQVLKLPELQRENLIKELKSSIIPFDLVLVAPTEEFIRVKRQEFLSKRENTEQDLKDQTLNTKLFDEIYGTNEFNEIKDFIKSFRAIYNPGDGRFFENLDDWISKHF